MAELKKLEKKLGFTFKKPELMELAFVHRSFLNENNEYAEHNERLEFLGDAVLELIVTEYLYLTFEKEAEGQLTNWRSALVRGDNLAKIARDLKLGEYLKLSKGEENSGGRDKDYILANAVEALIGAIYLDKGFKWAKVFIDQYVIVKLDEILKHKLYIDGKSQFQELAQAKVEITPEYKLVKEEGPDHDKEFTMAVYLGAEKVAEGKGKSKQAAEEQAARKGLEVKGWI
ncbi:MAG: ribonuclease III [Candidatus Gracilibacteria bacterium]|nr:ribonuclease III [Candidatus Gracilibacteria bacterium]